MKAFRTISEDDDFHVIEFPMAFGGPFPENSDSYGTRATARTNFYWDLFRDRTPADPPEIEPGYVRPLNYQHGFDDAVGLSRVGGFSPMRADKKAVWLQAQLDKHHAYYNELRAMIDEDALAFSPESAEHAVRFAKNGDWIDWPLYTGALTPTAANPWNQVATRTAETARVLIRVAGIRQKGMDLGPPEGGMDREDIPTGDYGDPDNKKFPIVTQASVDDAASLIGKAANPDAVKARIIAIAKRKGFTIPDAWQEEASARSAFRMASDDVACAAGIQQQIAWLMGCESDEAAQLAHLQTAFDELSAFIALESKEIGTETDTPMEMAMPAFMSALREGRRNSGSDQALIDGMHDATVALGTSSHMDGMANDDRSPDAGRAAALPIRVHGMERAHAKKTVQKALRKAIRRAARTGSEVGATEVHRLVGRA